MKMSNAIELVNMESKAEAEMAPVLARAREFVVVDQMSYEAADSIIAEVRIKVKDRETEIGPAKEAATKSWQAMNALWKKFITDPLEACKTLDRKRYQWKKSEDDHRAREAEALRREQERKQAEEKLKLAERLEAAGMKSQADAALNAPSAPVSVPEPVKVDKPKGQTYVENWQARVVDEKLVPRDYLTPDLVALGKLVKLLKGKASVPGVVFEDVGSVRRSA
jgi:hypothetical protein